MRRRRERLSHARQHQEEKRRPNGSRQGDKLARKSRACVSRPGAPDANSTREATRQESRMSRVVHSVAQRAGQSGLSSSSRSVVLPTGRSVGALRPFDSQLRAPLKFHLHAAACSQLATESIATSIFWLSRLPARVLERAARDAPWYVVRKASLSASSCALCLRRVPAATGLHVPPSAPLAKLFPTVSLPVQTEGASVHN